MRKVVCMGESILSPLGATPAENFAAVCRGESALQRYEGMFGVHEPFVASLMDRDRWTVPGRTFFDSLVVAAGGGRRGGPARLQAATRPARARRSSSQRSKAISNSSIHRT